MKPSTRITTTNRRERARGPDLTDALLRAAIACLALLGLFRRREGTPKGKERLSEVQDREFRRWCQERAAENGDGGFASWTAY